MKSEWDRPHILQGIKQWSLNRQRINHDKCKEMKSTGHAAPGACDLSVVPRLRRYSQGPNAKEEPVLLVARKDYICGLWTVFAARKRSLMQGNIFISVCHSCCPQGGGGGFRACITGHMTREVCIQWGSASRGGVYIYERLGRPPPIGYYGAMGYGQQVGGTHSTGMHSCLKGVRIHVSSRTEISLSRA